MSPTLISDLLPKHIPTSRLSFHRVFVALVCALIIFVSCKSSYAQGIEIVDPKVPAGTTLVTQYPVLLTVTVSNPEVKKIRVLVTKVNDQNEMLGASSKDLDLDPAKQKHPITVGVFQGRNNIRLLGFRPDQTEPDASISTSIVAMCSGDNCGIEPASGPVGGVGFITPSSGDVIIGPLAGPDGVKDTPTIDSTIAVQKKSGIKKLVIEVRNNGQRVDQKDLVEVKDLTEALGIATAKLKVAAGTNLIRVFDANTLTSQASAEVVCTGEKCSKIGENTPGDGEREESSAITVAKIEKVATPSLRPYLTVAKDSQIKRINVEILNGDKKTVIGPFDVTYANDQPGILNPEIRVLKGTNSLRFYDADNPPTDKNQAYAQVICEGPHCATDFKNISIKQPAIGHIAEDKPTIESRIVVQRSSGINNIKIRVIDAEGNYVEDEPNFKAIPLVYGDAESVEVRRQLRIVEGNNTIVVLDADKPEEVTNQDARAVTCQGPNCGFVDTAGSQSARMVTGFEQIGASSAESKTKPFLDFFFTNPLHFNKRSTALPFWSAWGQIRFSTTPEQIAAVGAFPSNLINQVSRSANVVDLVQSFDYLAGFDFRLFGANGKFLGLGKYARRTHFYFVAGAGAISPLNARDQTAQIFKVPSANSGQRDLFVNRFGAEATNKTFIGFVVPERDRFLRQYYAGIRLKTYDCEDSDCNRYLNHFPAIVDFMIGQNEAVTGGKFKHNVTDSTGKIIGDKRSFVLRLDGFVPLTYKNASVYFYGTAMMKIGQGGVRITTPLFLDQAAGDILLTNPDVFIAPTLQLDRDYYKIGVGFDLMRLFRGSNR